MSKHDDFGEQALKQYDKYLASKATSEIGDPAIPVPPFMGVAIIGAICAFFGFLLGAFLI